MDKYLEMALDLAIENVERGGQPFGAVLVENNQVIATGVNQLDLTFDISDHAEMIAIRQAQNRKQSLDLKGCIMYASGQPCPMCLGALYFSGIAEVYFVNSIEDAAQHGLGMSRHIYQELMLPINQRALKMEQVVLNDKQDPMTLWEEKNKPL